MKKTLFLIAIGFALLIVTSQAEDKNTAPPQITISKVERTQKWKMPGPFGSTAFVEAKEGEEVLVIHLSVKGKSITINGFSIIDDTGKKNDKCKTNIMGWEGAVPPGGIAVPFTIPKGLRVKKLVIRDPAMQIDIPEKRP